MSSRTDAIRTSWVRRLATAAVVLAVGFTCVSWPQAADARSRLIGRQAPPVTVPDGINGIPKGAKLSDYKGSVVLLVFFTPGCRRCPPVMAAVQRMHARYKGRGLKTLAVAGTQRSRVVPYARQKRYTFGMGIDPRAVNARRYQVRLYPTVFIVGKDGIIKPLRGTWSQTIEHELEQAAPKG